jgi:hypothetical protein
VRLRLAVHFYAGRVPIERTAIAIGLRSTSFKATRVLQVENNDEQINKTTDLLMQTNIQVHTTAHVLSSSDTRIAHHGRESSSEVQLGTKDSPREGYQSVAQALPDSVNVLLQNFTHSSRSSGFMQ